MDLYNKLQEELKKSLKARQEQKLSVIRMLISDIKYQKIANGDVAFKDESILKTIQKQIKRHQDSFETFKKAGRAESADKEAAEIEILKQYLPNEA